jgi:hypothetical protein
VPPLPFKSHAKRLFEKSKNLGVHIIKKDLGKEGNQDYRRHSIRTPVLSLITPLMGYAPSVPPVNDHSVCSVQAACPLLGGVSFNAATHP